MNSRSESDEFSEIGKLGNLSKFTFDQLHALTTSMNPRAEEFIDHKLLILETDEVLISLRFSLDGIFIQIERDVWKNHGLDLNRQVQH
jgi:hypothetical protein